MPSDHVATHLFKVTMTFYLTILTFFLAIANLRFCLFWLLSSELWYKLATESYKVRIFAIRGNKVSLSSSELGFITRSYMFISHNSRKEVRIARYKLAIARKKSHITRYKITIVRKKSQNCDIKFTILPSRELSWRRKPTTEEDGFTLMSAPCGSTENNTFLNTSNQLKC